MKKLTIKNMPILKDSRELKNIKLPKSGILVKVRDGILAQDIEKIEKEESEIKQILILLSRIIEDWDATDESDQKLPVTVENINLFSIDDIKFIQESLSFVKDFLAKANPQDMK